MANKKEDFFLRISAYILNYFEMYTCKEIIFIIHTFNFFHCVPVPGMGRVPNTMMEHPNLCSELWTNALGAQTLHNNKLYCPPCNKRVYIKKYQNIFLSRSPSKYLALVWDLIKTRPFCPIAS